MHFSSVGNKTVSNQSDATPEQTSEPISELEIKEENEVSEISEEEETANLSNENGTVLKEVTEVSETEENGEQEYDVLPLPNDEEIIVIEDYKQFYQDYQNGDDGKWYKITLPVYSVEDDHLIIHDDLGKILGMYCVYLADPSVTKTIHRGDNVTVIALSDYKKLNILSMYSAYVESVEETANTIYDDQVIIINDYVFFYEHYDSPDIGKMVQITAKVDSADEVNLTIKEGLPDSLTSMIVAYLADGEEVVGINSGDTVTFYGRTSSKFGKSLTLEDVHIGESDCKNKVIYEESDSYKIKLEESQAEIEYMKCTVKTMLDDMSDNPVRAKEKYEDQFLEVTGVVCDISGNGKRIDLGLSKNSTLDSIMCMLDESTEINKVKKISNGDTITIRGKCSHAGKTLGYSVSNTEIISIE